MLNRQRDGSLVEAQTRNIPGHVGPVKFFLLNGLGKALLFFLSFNFFNKCFPCFCLDQVINDLLDPTDHILRVREDAQVSYIN
ncbi:hypothetical protein GLYMA_01G101200v4 [Glycine max]|uniref:Uncharacterized protein n=1 Tax=Glycine max TaxID=3847 RepID=K7K2Z1_SOYBN|nr:hypothetical protein JHK87_001187 [Glycine soja]KAG5068840.1 hypothetical protein JHK85_001217 [Glycine max]KAH1162460.1 hypothetical protein GYH30_001089 [Glycine max]KRH75686.1 hypothetical protein GLYMA_01G101200v4 [Glycine max]